MAARLPVRILARQARAHCTRRAFSSTSYSLEAQNFMMPAMSPTMTEGNIASWKVKEGDSFASGDVLLEIETDKASMDVEAQEDGVMAKIFVGDGSKAVAVGTRIAVLAEEGDDLDSLKIPEDTSEPVKGAAENVSKAAEEQATQYPAPKGTPENKRPDRDRPKTSPKGPGQNPKYPLYPAVQSLILANHIPEADVMKIPATGPNGRLLKGDVLAYLGSIESDYSKSQSERIQKLGKLDLSNIKVAPSGAPAGATTGPAVGPDSGVAKEEPKLTSVTISVSLAEVLRVQQRVQETLGVSMPLSAFLARAVDQANDNLPLPKGSKPSSDALFNAILGLDKVPTSSRGTYLPQITALPSFTTASSAPSLPKSTSTRAVRKPVDIIDILSGKAKPARSAVGRAMLAGDSSPSVSITGTSGAINMFSLTVPAGEEKRARTFLERVKTILQVEPGRLVL